MRLAKVNAASLEGGMIDSKEGMYPGLLLTGFMVSISLGLMSAKLTRLCIGDRWRLVLRRVALRTSG